MIEIDHDIPVPIYFRGGDKWILVVQQMKIGDSVLVPTVSDRTSVVRAIGRAYGKGSVVSRTIGSKIVGRGTPITGYRVWRVR